MRQARLEALLIEAAQSANPKVPEGGLDVWNWFVALSNARCVGMAANPIGFADIDAFARLHRLPIEGRHVTIIRKMDDAFLQAQRDRAEAMEGKPVRKRSNGQPLTAAIFDAVF